MKEKMRLYVEPDADSKSGMRLFLVAERHRWATNDNQIDLGETEAHYVPPDDLSDDTLRLRAIQTLRDKQDRVIAEAEQERARLQQHIDNLLLLTHQVT